MTEKINWYQEVLELDPHSRLFLPLARLLLEDGQRERALRTLEEGLRRHPECVEARLLQIEVLYRAGGVAACRERMEEITAIFGRYPGFWEAWSATLSAVDTDSDAALAPLLLLASFRKRRISLARVLERGVWQALGRDGASSAVTADSRVGVVASPEQASSGDVADPAAPGAVVSQRGVSPEMREGTGVGADRAREEAPEARPRREEMTPPAAVFQTVPVADRADDSEEECFSLRTRSMADVLAEQGDISGALEIYQELVRGAATPAERRALEERMAVLRGYAGSGENALSATADAEESAGVLSLLDALARRLEARARGELTA